MKSNNSNKEININDMDKNEEFKYIKIIIDYQAKSFDKLFNWCRYYDSIVFKKFNISYMTDLTDIKVCS